MSARPLTGILRRPALLLFVFLTAVYLLTAGVARGGYGYSPDGTFAFEMAKSLVIDPDHEYLRNYYRNFSRWGVGMPVLLAPLVAFAEPLADVAPQRDRLVVDGYEYLLSPFNAVGHPSVAQASSTPFDIPQRRISEFSMVSHLGLSVDIPTGMQVALIRITGADGLVRELPVRAGIETAEWAYERADVRGRIRHDRGRVVGNHIGNTRANFYFARYRFAVPIEARSAEVVYNGPPGVFYLDAAAVRDVDTGQTYDVPGHDRIWSERQNKEFFRRLWSPIANVLLTAGTAVLVFKIVRYLGNGPGVGLVVGLAYGLGTMAWPYAKFDFTEPAVAFFTTAGALAALRYQADRRIRLAALTGLLLLLAVLTKYVAVIALPFFALHLVLARKGLGGWWKPLAAFAAPFAILVIPALAVLALKLDFRILYERELIAGIQRGWLGVPLWLGVRGLLFSWGKSLFLYSPVLVLAAPSAILFVRRYGWRTLLFLGIPAAYVLLYAKKEVWYGGNSWGPRYLVPTLPLLIVTLAPLLDWVAARRRRWTAVAVAAVLAISLIPQLLGLAKDFDQYLGIYADQVVRQLAENGAIYGGKEYQRWSSIQPEGDLAAVLFAPQFTPLLGHFWLLRADVIEAVLPDRGDLLEDALGRTPWSRFGISVQPARPQDGMGLDFWSMTLWANYVNHKPLVAMVLGVLVALELAGLAALGLLLRTEPLRRNLPKPLRLLAVLGFAATVLAFDTLHFML